jgi:glycopeptide antibiotics resistance protein
LHDRWRLSLALALTIALVLGATLTTESPGLYRWLARDLGDTGALLLARLLNVVLFVPLGVVLGSHFRPRALWLVVALSVAVELSQFALVQRNPDLLDVVTNSAGGVLGYLIGRWWTRRHADEWGPFGR